MYLYITFELNTLLGNPQHLRNFSLSKYNEGKIKISSKNVQKDPGNPPCSPCCTQIQFPAAIFIKTITLTYRSLKQLVHSCSSHLNTLTVKHHRHRTILLRIDDLRFCGPQTKNARQRHQYYRIG